MNRYGPVHTLRVTAPDQGFVAVYEDEDGYDYQILHPDECETYPTDDGDQTYDCAVANLCTDLGTYWALGIQQRNDEPNHLPAGEHRIQAWADTWTIPGEATEHDAGIDFLDPTGQPVQPGAAAQ